MAIEVSSAILQRLLDEAESAHPNEACGLLLGRNGRVKAIVACANVHPNPERRFEIDPQALIEAHRAARAGGPEVVGYYHSHPAGPPQPSATDRAQATGDGRVWAIVGEGRVEWWHDEPGGFTPLSYTASHR
jgi:desampylase